jgi:hypothetical protein
MSSFEIDRLIKAASERQVAVQALQKKYASSINIPTEQLVLDMRELLLLSASCWMQSSLCSSKSTTPHTTSQLLHKLLRCLRRSDRPKSAHGLQKAWPMTNRAPLITALVMLLRGRQRPA